MWMQHQQLQEQLNSPAAVRPDPPGIDILLFRDPCWKIHTQKISLWHPRKGEQPQASPAGSPLITQSSHALLGNTGHSAG